jgi:hypothetical protein
VAQRLPEAVSILGTVTNTKSGGTVSAIVNGVTVIVQIARDLTVAAGDVVLINKYGAQWVAVQRLYTAAPGSTGNAPTPPVNPPTTSGRLTLGAVETRSYRTSGGWRTDDSDVRQGQYGGNGNHTGCVFYGNGPRSLAGATVTSAYILARRGAGGVFAAQTSTMRLVTESTRPSGAPTLTSTAGGPSLAVNTQTNFIIPTAWAQSMVDGTAGGLGFFVAGATPWIIFTGIGTYSPSFTININWTR